ncbi:MAG: energy-coupling factor ABC transporter permease [Methanomassiliicoccales archaeon]|nr:energy-coupling factor ABC transporter permease [Methanomassiliicoccales archaeon]
MEGYLPLEWALLWSAVSIPFLVWGAMKVKRMFAEHPELKLTVAVSAAYMFVLSALKLPSVAGSSSHPTGSGLSTVFYGVGVTSLLASIVLIFQALLLAHGGLTTLGANIFSMGIAGPLVAYVVYRTMQKANLSMSISVFSAAFFADIVTYITTSFQLALAYPSGGSVLSSFEAFFAVFAIAQIPLAVAEGILLVIFFNFLAENKPNLLAGVVRTPSPSLKGRRNTVLGVAVVMTIAVAVIANAAIGLLGTDNQGAELVQQIDPNYQPWFSNFFVPSEGMELLLFAVQALIGLTILVYFILYLRRKRSEWDSEVS